MLRNRLTVPLQALIGPEGSRKLGFPEFLTTAQDGGKVFSLISGHFHTQEIFLLLISVRDKVDSRAIMQSEGIYINEIFL